MVMGLVSGLSLANHSDSESFPVVHSLFSQDGCQREGFWEVVGPVVSPFDLSQTLPVGGGLLVPCSLPGPPVIKQHMQMVTMVPGQGGWFQSVRFPQQVLPFPSLRDIAEPGIEPMSPVWQADSLQLSYLGSP